MMKKKQHFSSLMAVKWTWYVCLVPSVNWNVLERRENSTAQSVMVFCVHVSGCACFCLLIGSCVLVCMIAKLTLICLFTSHDVRALCNRILCERAGRRSLQEGAQILPQIFLFSLLNRRPMCIRIMGLSAYLRAPPADKQSHTHTRKSRWITGTARAVLGVYFS